MKLKNLNPNPFHIYLTFFKICQWDQETYVPITKLTYCHLTSQEPWFVEKRCISWSFLVTNQVLGFFFFIKKSQGWPSTARKNKHMVWAFIKIFLAL